MKINFDNIGVVRSISAQASCVWDDYKTMMNTLNKKKKAILLNEIEANLSHIKDLLDKVISE